MTHSSLVAGLAGADEVREGDGCLGQGLAEQSRNVGAELWGRRSCRSRGLLDLQPVLVGTCGEAAGPGAAKPPVAVQRVGQQRGVEVPEVRRPVGVEDGRREQQAAAAGPGGGGAAARRRVRDGEAGLGRC